MAPIEIFVSYSHKDERLRQRLGTHLSILRRERVIDEWHDRCIAAGQEWAGAIDAHLNAAAVILLLISADFLDSDYCYNLEMKRALERHDAGDARVIPVILRRVDWFGAPFGKLQALPKDGRPVKSWRDPDDAYTDIVRGIRKVVEELRARPSPPPAEVAGGRRGSQRLPPIWNVPFLRNTHFTGREALLDELNHKLARGRAVLTAMAGVGKTQVATEYAYRHAHEFDLVWWLRAEEPTTLQEDYAALAAPLGLEAAKERQLSVVAYAVRRELSRRDGWLLVFDNATGPNEVLPHLAEGDGRILITSRHRSWPFVASIEVPPLVRTASVALLLSWTGQDDRSAAEALAEELGDLPLALEQAASFVRESGIPLSEYLQRFRARRAVA